ncbi:MULTISPECIES: helix-turn-helix domain-containing protein [unclassified Providencia]|uniref:helix-turn-helix domain-containing protein n=1 Tax=unclassified Providencia TaxID=2633465 RepID=UPI000E931891|nr:helix-turn-helix transcriptional regulator [Providencia sp.]MBP6080336.1 helix-turn-helix domain-containing protein [Providencia sp.]HBO24435.1 XRE family transcriptional regulator [Providencia sp.]
MTNNLQLEDAEVSIYIGQFLKLRRKKVGLTGAQLASRLSISQQQVSRYERGINALTIQGLLDILQALDLRKHDIDEFVKNIFSFYFVNFNTEAKLIH